MCLSPVSWEVFQSYKSSVGAVDVHCPEGAGLFYMTTECQLQRLQEKEPGYLEKGLVVTSSKSCDLWWLQLLAETDIYFCFVRNLGFCFYFLAET